MRVLLVSTYELGHQPLHVASPAAALLRAGHDVRCLDVSVEPWDDAVVDGVDAVAFSVPMHTAMRVAVAAARAARERRPGLPVCFYGLYAPVSRDTTVGTVADRVIAGEYEPALVAWVDEVAARAAGSTPGPPASTFCEDPYVRQTGFDSQNAVPAGGNGGGSAATGTVVHLGRGRFQVPARHLLPPLERYAHLAVDGEERLVGYVEASHGCASRCRHCPVPTVYDGRIRVVGADVVLDDVAQLVDAGARHITFGDPDFLNGVHHSLRVVRGVHERFPELTFDCTTKVELILRHDDIWAEMAAAGCLFVVSAVECVNDDILERLDKGHTAADAGRAVHLLREHGIEMRPSLLPFTPWTTLDDLVDLLDFVAAHDLFANVDPVQCSIRLLLPEGSLLLDHPDLAPHLGHYDAERLTWTWRAADPRVDELQARVAALVEERTAAGDPPGAVHLAVNAMVRAAAGRPADGLVAAGSTEGRPRLTEPWFC